MTRGKDEFQGAVWISRAKGTKLSVTLRQTPGRDKSCDSRITSAGNGLPCAGRIVFAPASRIARQLEARRSGCSAKIGRIDEPSVHRHRGAHDHRARPRLEDHRGRITGVHLGVGPFPPLQDVWSLVPCLSPRSRRPVPGEPLAEAEAPAARIAFSDAWCQALPPPPTRRPLNLTGRTTPVMLPPP
jgi:hypothetical protein